MERERFVFQYREDMRKRMLVLSKRLLTQPNELGRMIASLRYHRTPLIIRKRMTPRIPVIAVRRKGNLQARGSIMSIQRMIDRMVEIPGADFGAGEETQALVARDEGAVETVRLHLAGGVEAVAAVEDAGGRAFAVLLGVYRELEIGEGRPLVIS